MKLGDSLPVSVTVSKAHADGHHYSLDAKGPGSLTVGGDGEVEITLSAKDRYRLDEKYPYKLAASADPSGIVQLEQSEIDRSKGAFTKTEARYRVRFKAKKVGAAKVGGTLSVSVCSGKDCVVENVEIVVPVTVK